MSTSASAGHQGGAVVVTQALFERVPLRIKGLYMNQIIDNVITEHLKGLRSEVQSLRGEMHAEFKDVKHRLVSVETMIVASKHEAADIRGDYVRQQVSIDSLLERIQRLERRLELS